MPANTHSPDHAEALMRELLENADLPQPDEVCHDAGSDELILLWHDPKTAVVIDLNEA